MADPETVLAQISSGSLRGERSGGVHRFLSIPYAAAPTKERRFKGPAPHPGWEGVRAAVERGPNAPQIARSLPGLNLSPIVGDGWRQGAEYLALNIWAPDRPAAPAYPVMVFVHGGAFVGGTGDAPVYDGTSFAQRGIVCVTLNYRVGVEGFAVLEGAPTNLGLRDILAALQWIQVEIATFGGDPKLVTIFGESSGAMSIGDLIASPVAQGLFHRAILQSGHGGMVRSKAVSMQVSAALAAHLGVEPSAAAFATRSEADCATALDAVSQAALRLDLRSEDGTDEGFGLSRFLPVYGDDVIPIPPLEAAAAGAGRQIELLIGSNSQEMNLYFVPTGLAAQADAAMATAVLSAVIPDALDVLRDYGLGAPEVSPGQALSDALTDLVFRQPVRDFAAAHQGPVHVYEFSWRSPGFGGRLGACHALELPFVFNTIDVCTGPDGLLGEAPPRELAEHIHDLWIAFAKGEPLPWPAYDAAARPVYDLQLRQVIAEPLTPLVKGRTHREDT